MPGSTSKGLIYPVGSDAVAQGDLQVKALADSVNAAIPGAVQKVGTVSTTTNASGQVVVNHGMGVTPVFVGVNSVGSGGTAHEVAVTGHTNSQFTATVRLVTTGANVASTAVTLNWYAASA